MKNADSVATALRAIGGAAAFVSRGTLPASALAFTVEGVGRVAFPISEATARQLCRVAQPAQHGYREETRLDRRVRDCFEIDARQIGIARDEWPATLQTQLARIARDLGLPAGCRLEAELHKLLIYGPGQFFVGHQDSEKCDAMVATLVVGLPSSFRGGTMLIEHQGETVQVRGSTSRLAFTAFYADCRHQVRPVTQGYRAALTYNLMLEGPVAAQTTPLDQLRPLIERLRRYFASPIPPRWAGEGKDGVLPDRLIYLLDHEYTQRGLDWQRLKGADGARATALQTAAATLECATCLALVEVHETWSCTSDWDGGYQSRWDYEDEEEDEDEDEGATGAEEQVLTDLIDSEVVLRHFVSSEGKSVKMPKQIDPRELCYTRPTVEFDPFESEHEGYMGNYGNTVDRWYHRAAVVVWPRNREFALRGKVEPGWALAELSRVLCSTGAGAAAIRAAQLLPFWAQAVPVSDDENLLAQALELASGLDDAQLATGLLAPFALPQFTKGMAGPWQRCLGRYGLRWSQALLAEWLKAWDAREASRLQWIADELPDLCEASHDAATSDARALAEGLLRQEWCWIRSVWRKRSQLSASSARDAAVSALASPLLGLLAAAMRMECMAVAEEITNALTASGGDVAAEALLALDLLRAAQEQSDGRLNTNLKPLREHWLAQLAALLEQAPRRADDWSILLPMQCSCRYCMELNGFLGDGQRIRHEWPLAEAHRKHLHQIVDSHELPVTHQTRRSGRPYVLVLQKTSALFAREAAQRRVWQRNLDWLAGLTKERWSDASPGAGQPR